MNQEKIKQYIDSAKKQGVPDNFIHTQLLHTGYSADEVAEAFGEPVLPVAKPADPLPGPVAVDLSSPSPITSTADNNFDPIYTTIGHKPATPLQRIIHWILDYSVFAPVHATAVGVIILIILKLTLNPSLEGGLTSFVYTVSYLSYFFIWEVTTGRTISKFITSTKVVTKTGAKPSVGQILLRTTTRLISIPFFYFFSGAKLRAIHDTFSSTLVVKN